MDPEILPDILFKVYLQFTFTALHIDKRRVWARKVGQTDTSKLVRCAVRRLCETAKGKVVSIHAMNAYEGVEV
jgi:hypothetical protein